VLVQRVCAAIRSELLRAVGGGRADRLLAQAAAQVLATHDPGSGLDALTANLVRLLDEEGDLNDELVVAGGMEGEMTFVAHALSRRAGVAPDLAMDELLSATSAGR
jgi:hypothetical protein